MPEYLLHPNGRGRLYGDAEANQSTYISKDSSASGFAKLRDCRLVADSKARENCQVYGGVFHRCCIDGKTIIAGRPEAEYSYFNCSEVSGHPILQSVDLIGGTEVCDTPIIISCVLRDAIVYGSPMIKGGVFNAFEVTGRVHEGTWTRAPKHIKLPWVEMTECVDGKLILACRCRTIDYWLRHGAKLAKRWDWSQDQIDVTLETIAREFASISKVAA